MKVRIATRRSRLALVQTRWIGDRIRGLEPKAEIELVEMLTMGDRMRDVPLANIGGKGLFVSEIEQAVREGRADIAVHSMKDLPAELGAGLQIACIPEREDPRDAFITVEGCELDDLAAGDRVGTSSLRRMIQLRRQRNDLEYAPLRGNVDTRLSKLAAGEFRAIVLAYAGLKRLALSDRPLWPLPVAVSVPAVGQGALAVQCRDEDHELAALLRRFEHENTRVCVEAERAFLHALGGDCHTPLAGHANLEHNRLRFDGLVGAVADERMISAGTERYTDATGAELVEVARALGRETARALLSQGAAELIEDARKRAEASRYTDPRARPH